MVDGAVVAFRPLPALLAEVLRLVHRGAEACAVLLPMLGHPVSANSSAAPQEREARHALTCLYIAVEESVARDVDQKVTAALDALRAELEGLRAQVAGLEAERDGAMDALADMRAEVDESMRSIARMHEAQINDYADLSRRETGARALAEKLAGALTKIAEANPDAPEVESWKWLARSFMEQARAALSASREPEDAPKDAVLHNSCADEETK